MAVAAIGMVVLLSSTSCSSTNGASATDGGSDGADTCAGCSFDGVCWHCPTGDGWTELLVPACGTPPGSCGQSALLCYACSGPGELAPFEPGGVAPPPITYPTPNYPLK